MSFRDSEIEEWLRAAEARLGIDDTQNTVYHIRPEDCMSHESSPVSSIRSNTSSAQFIAYEERMKAEVKRAAEARLGIDDTQNTVYHTRPEDCMSHVSSAVSSVRSNRSSVQFIAYEERMKAEARTAELLAHSSILKEKQKLEEEENRLKYLKQEVDLKAELAATEARANVFRQYEDDCRSIDREKDTKKYLFSGIDKRSLGHESIESKPKYKSRIQTKEHKQPPYLDTSFHDILSKQNKLMELVMEQQAVAKLPYRDIATYNGNPLEFHSFMTSFEHIIENRTSNDRDKFYYLAQYTRGEPHSLVQSCMHMRDEDCFWAAKDLLKKKFGDPFKVASAYLDKALNWPSLKSEDVNALNSYSLFLTGCKNIMGNIEHLRELDHPTNLRTLISKLPFKLRERWRTQAHYIQGRQRRYPDFTDLTMFVEEQAQIVSNPLYGDILQDKGQDTRNKGQVFPQKSKIRSSSYSTVISETENSRASKFEPPEKKETSMDKPDLRSSNEGERRGYSFRSPCLYCHEEHTLEMCKRLRNKRDEERIRFLRSKRLCFSCLNYGHLSKDCNKKLTCKLCGKPHATVLHTTYRKPSETSCQPKEVAKMNHATVRDGESNGAGNRTVGMPIIPVKVKLENTDEFIETYAFLDNGSSATFCTENLMKRMRLQGRRTQITLHTLGQRKEVDSFIIKNFEVSSLEGDNLIKLPEVYTQKQIPVSRDDMYVQEDLNEWSYLDEVSLPSITGEVELLIGNNVPRALEPWQVINSQGGGPYAVKTLLGWTVSNHLRESDDFHGIQRFSVNRIALQKGTDLHKQLRDYFNHDFSERTVDEKPEMSQEDQQFLRIMKTSVQVRDGHYQLDLPFRDPDLMMPNNKPQAVERMNSLKRKLLKNEQYYQDYKGFIDKILKKGYAQKVPVDKLDRSDGRVWYLIHHGIYHPKKPQKIRVVFDCSARYQGTSLNDQLIQGPDLTNTLLGVLLRFRQEPVAMMSDIEAMFYQVNVNPDDYDVLRFLWWPDGNMNEEFQEFQMKVHIFGAASSPSCSNFALRQIIKDHEDLSPSVHTTIEKNFYVDDCLKSVPRNEEAVELVQKLSTACQRGGFHLTKWISNSRTVLDNIPESELANEVKDLDLDKNSLPIERALGLKWCVESDKFKVKIEIGSKPATRRGILSIVSSVYDPLGLVAPFILPAKSLLQELCRLKYGWDQEISEKHQRTWISWLQNLHKLEDLSIDRCVKSTTQDNIVSTQIHTFADASETGYGTVSYLRQLDTSGQVQCAFLIGKSRVAPLKQVTIPRLELTAATVAVRVNSLLCKELEIPVEKTYFWTDSMSVLGYIQNQSTRYQTFVANRIAVIHDMSDQSQWNHVSSEENPADDASRGLSLKSVDRCDRWLQGPDFLKQPEEQWSYQKLNIPPATQNDPEVKKVCASNLSEIEASETVNKLIAYYSDWFRLKKAVAWILRVKSELLERSKQKNSRYNLRSRKSTVKSDSLTVKDLENAEIAILKFVQGQAFTEEISHLKSQEKTNNRIKRRSPLYKLDPFLKDGILHVGGRIRRAKLKDSSKYPVILPKKSHVSTLIIQHIHQAAGHMGRNYILSLLAERYWILRANSAVRSILNKCVSCRRLYSRSCEQKMADLPSDRLIYTDPPFTYVGIDYFGPFVVKRARSHVKRYGVLFTCLTVRAIHLEMAHSLDTDSCICAIRRFIARRGQVKSIRSDNGTNLVGSERELREQIEQWNQLKIHESLLQKNVDWIFNPPTASHFGGVWERQIKTVRKVLSGLVKEQILDDEGLQTVFCEIEAIINSRPISTVSSDPKDVSPLTPNHLLLLKEPSSLPPGLFRNEDQYAKRRWRQVQYMSDLFWKRWVREYLPLCQQRQKWIEPKRNLQVGDIVIVVDSLLPRCSWTMGRILNVYPDKQGHVRQVQVKTKTSTLDRPVNKLCLLLENEQ